MNDAKAAAGPVAAFYVSPARVPTTTTDMAEQGIKKGIRIQAATDNCEVFNDSGSTAPTTVDYVVKKDEWLGQTTGYFVRVLSEIFVEFYYETGNNTVWSPRRKYWKWVRSSQAKPVELGHEDWLDQAKLPAPGAVAVPTTPTPNSGATPNTTTGGQGSLVYPPSPDKAESDRLLAEFKRNYPSFPQPQLFKASDGKWYYRFDNGQTAEVDAWAKLTASQQASLSGGKDLGIGFKTTLASSGNDTGGSGQRSNLLVWIGAGLAVLITGIVVFLNLKKRK